MGDAHMHKDMCVRVHMRVCMPDDIAEEFSSPVFPSLGNKIFLENYPKRENISLEKIQNHVLSCSVLVKRVRRGGYVWRVHSFT